jgi:anaerobic selenocysteine-containing dehydrogenase
VISQIMRRMDLPVEDHVPEAHDAEGADEVMLAWQMQGARCSFDELVRSGKISQPMEVPGHWVDRHIEKIGGWRLAPAQLLTLWDEIRAQDEAQVEQPGVLFLTPRRQRRKLNASLSFLGSPADIILHPDDASAQGITDGQQVQVRTSQGEIVLTATVSDTVRRGVASIPHGHESANVNYLTSVQHVDRMTGMVRYSGIPIEVTPVT